MAYTKVLWQNSPSTATPMNAQNLNHMDDQIALNDQRLTDIETAGVVNTFNSRTGNVTSEKGDYDINQIVASDGQDGYIPVWRNSGTEQEPDWGFEMESVSGGGGLATCNSVDPMTFAYVVTPYTDFSITEGLYLSVIFSNNFTYDGVHTLRLSIDGVGYDVKINGQNPTASVIYVKSGDAGIFVFDGTYFQLIGTSGGGHIIWTQDGSNMPQESGLQFADGFLTDDSVNGRTVVENIKEHTTASDYENATEDGIHVIDDGNDVPIGAIDEDVVTVEHDGTKTWRQLLDELFSEIDVSKVTNKTTLVGSDGSAFVLNYKSPTNTVINFIHSEVQAYFINATIQNSNSVYSTGTNGSVTDISGNIATIDFTLYYGTSSTVINLKTDANYCQYDENTTVKQKIDESSKVVSLGGGISYTLVGKVLTLVFSLAQITDGMTISLPSSLIANCIMLTLRDESVGGVSIVAMNGAGQIVSGAGASNFTSGHNYSGSISCLVQ